MPWKPIYILCGVFLPIATVTWGKERASKEDDTPNRHSLRLELFLSWLESVWYDEGVHESHPYIPDSLIPLIASMLNQDRKKRPRMTTVDDHLRLLSQFEMDYFGLCCHLDGPHELVDSPTETYLVSPSMQYSS